MKILTLDNFDVFKLTNQFENQAFKILQLLTKKLAKTIFVTKSQRLQFLESFCIWLKIGTTQVLCGLLIAFFLYLFVSRSFYVLHNFVICGQPTFDLEILKSLELLRKQWRIQSRQQRHSKLFKVVSKTTKYNVSMNSFCLLSGWVEPV